MVRDIKRGEIYFISLDPAFGRELAGFKSRPVIVVSINSLNAETQMVTVVPGTDVNDRRSAKNSVIVESSDVVIDKNRQQQRNPIEKSTLFDCHQIRAVSRGRFTQVSYGRVKEEILAKLEGGIRFCLGFSPE